MLQKYKQKSKQYQKGVEVFNLKYEKSFYKNSYIKQFYSFVKSKLKLSSSLPSLSNAGVGRMKVLAGQISNLKHLCGSQF